MTDLCDAPFEYDPGYRPTRSPCYRFHRELPLFQANTKATTCQPNRNRSAPLEAAASASKNLQHSPSMRHPYPTDASDPFIAYCISGPPHQVKQLRPYKYPSRMGWFTDPNKKSQDPIVSALRSNPNGPPVMIELQYPQSAPSAASTLAGVSRLRHLGIISTLHPCGLQPRQTPFQWKPPTYPGRSSL